MLRKANYNFPSTDGFLESCTVGERLLTRFCVTVRFGVQEMKAKM